MSKRGIGSAVAWIGLGFTALLLASCAAPQRRSTPAEGGSGKTAVRPSDQRASGGADCGPLVLGRDKTRESVVFVGELHGTNEFPETFAHVVCQTVSDVPSGRVLVALELPSRMQPAIDAFLGSSGEAARTALTRDGFWQREFQDGRSSIAMVRLLESFRDMQASGSRIDVRGIDCEECASADERDGQMARNLSDAISEIHPDRTFVYCGDVHAWTASGYPWDPGDPYRSCAARIREARGDVTAIRLKSTGGTAWNCLTAVASECGAKDVPARPAAGLVGQLEPGSPQSGWQWTLNVGPVSASPPARDGEIKER